MNTITSAGGPYIILDQTAVRWWGANQKKAFIPTTSPFPDDYEAAGDLTDGVSHPPCNIAKFIGERSEALLVTMPFEIAIICKTPSCAYLAQAEYADPEWSFSNLSLNAFSEADFDEQILFNSSGSTYWLFDSAYLPSEIGQDRLEFELAVGEYVLSAAMYQPDHRTGLFLYKIQRVDL